MFFLFSASASIFERAYHFVVMWQSDLQFGQVLATQSKVIVVGLQVTVADLYPS